MERIETTKFRDELKLPATPVFIALIAAGLFIGIAAGRPANIGSVLPVALGLTVAGLLSWWLDSWKPEAGKALAVGSLVAGIVLIVLRFQAPYAAALLIIPVVLAVGLFGIWTGFGLACFSTFLLVGALFVDRTQISLEVAAVSGLVLWVLFALIAIYRRRVFFVTDWSWNRYLSALALLEEARSQRAQMIQTMEDLGHATQQLSQLNYKLASARMVAEDALRSKAMFVASVSHEFRTPLNMIIGLTDLLLETPEIYGEQLPPSLMQDLEIVLRNCEHLQTMINDVLDLSQIEAGRMALNKERVNLAEIIRRGVIVVQPLIEKKHVDIHLEIPADLPLVYCDRNRIRQVIVNLLSNAARFTDHGRIDVVTEQVEGQVIVHVKDTGPGIAPEDVAKLFQPFFQAENNLNVGRNSSGLGLTISKQFVELNGGRMWVESVLGEGSTFSFSLPLDSRIESQPVNTLAGQIVPGWEWYERTAPANLQLEKPARKMLLWDATGEAGLYFQRYASDWQIVERRELAGLGDSLDEGADAVVVNAPTPEDLPGMIGAVREMMHDHRDAMDTQQDVFIFGCCLPPRSHPAQKLGAQDYLLKPITRARLEEALENLPVHPARILVVDDNPDAPVLMARMVQLWDSEIFVDSAATGQGALADLREQSFDLVLLDIVLPDMSGWEVLEQIHRDPRLKDTMVLILSAQDPFSEPITSPLFVGSTENGLSIAGLLRALEIYAATLSETK